MSEEQARGSRVANGREKGSGELRREAEWREENEYSCGGLTAQPTEEGRYVGLVADGGV
ncbi:hypothetical protein [Natrialba magadii]|uniref:hypothetical protein n=1 Tax=Natrialba magadii TaxID=13769 RepID=UPI00135F18FC|nr:hypothetical protein [Natrialba magadii]